MNPKLPKIVTNEENEKEIKELYEHDLGKDHTIKDYIYNEPDWEETADLCAICNKFIQITPEPEGREDYHWISTKEKKKYSYGTVKVKVCQDCIEMGLRPYLKKLTEKTGKTALKRVEESKNEIEELISGRKRKRLEEIEARKKQKTV